MTPYLISKTREFTWGFFMPNFDKFGSYMDHKIIHPNLYTYRYAISCVKDLEDTQLGKINASISTVLAAEKRRQSENTLVIC
jgi:hypothetical protein